jgi:hypothetical protein
MKTVLKKIVFLLSQEVYFSDLELTLCAGEGIVPNPLRLELAKPYPVATRSVETIR